MNHGRPKPPKPDPRLGTRLLEEIRDTLCKLLRVAERILCRCEEAPPTPPPSAADQARVDKMEHDLDVSEEKLKAAVASNQPGASFTNEEQGMNLTDLENQVKANTDAEAAAVVVINRIASELILVKNDPVKVQALADSLKASADALGAAVVANTPAAPTP